MIVTILIFIIISLIGVTLYQRVKFNDALQDQREHYEMMVYDMKKHYVPKDRGEGNGTQTNS